MTYNPLEDRRIYRQVAAQITQKLDAGEYRPGEQLPAERTLANLFNVSRASIREALIVLETNKQVEVRGGSGVFVLEREIRPLAMPDFTAVTRIAAGTGPLEVLLARQLIEPDIAALAARNIQGKHINALHQAMGLMLCCQKDDARYPEYDRQFHLQLAEASGNSALYLSVETLWGFRINPRHIHQAAAHAISAGQHAISEHRDIMIAVISRDSSAARSAMLRHLKRTKSRLSQIREASNSPEPELLATA